MVWRTCLRQDNTFSLKCSIFLWLHPFGPNSAHIQPHFVLTSHHRTLLWAMYVPPEPSEVRVPGTSNGQMKISKSHGLSTGKVQVTQVNQASTCLNFSSPKKYIHAKSSQQPTGKKHEPCLPEHKPPWDKNKLRLTLTEWMSWKKSTNMEHWVTIQKPPCGHEPPCQHKPPWHGTTWTTMHKI